MNKNKSNFNNKVEDISFKEILNLIKRNKFFILKIFLFLLGATTIYSYTIPKTYEGEFRIVLDTTDEETLLPDIGGAIAIAKEALDSIGQGGPAAPESLATEVKILESPSVLKPIFLYAKNEYTKSGIDVEKLTYKKWLENQIFIELLEGTSVLEIKYQDKKKDLIIPVLNRISEAYKKYSNRDKIASIKSSIKYTENQIENYRIETDLLNRKLDSFRIKYGIVMPIFSLDEAEEPPLPPEANPLTRLAVLNREIEYLSKIYTSNSPTIKRLRLEKEAVLNYIEKFGAGVIGIPNPDDEENLTSQEILLNYKELERKTYRSNFILEYLESNLLNLKLSEARSETPWELILPPTVLEFPVAPSKRKIVLTGFIISLLVSISIAAAKEKIKGNVFDREELKKILPYFIIGHLSYFNNMNNQTRIKSIVNLLNQKDKLNITFFQVGDIPKEQINLLIDNLVNYMPQNNFTLAENIAPTNKNNLNVILVNLGELSKDKLYQSIDEIEILGLDIFGVIIFDKNLKITK